MNKNLLNILALVCILFSSAVNAFAQVTVTGYQNKAYYDLSKEPGKALVPTSGDFRYRDDKSWWHNYGSGGRSAAIAIAAATDDIVVIKGSGVNSCLNGTKDDVLTASVGSAVYKMGSDVTSLTIGVDRYGYVQSIQVLSVDASAATVDYTINYVDESNNQIAESATVTSVVAATATATAAQMAAITVEGQKYLYKEGNAEITLDADATKNVITLVYRQAAAVAYTVKDNINNDVIASGNGFEGDVITVPFSQYLVSADKKLYSTPTAGSTYYGKSITLGADATQEETINYTLVEDYAEAEVVYFAEAENIEGMTSCATGNADARCSGQKGGFAAEDVTATTLAPGQYVALGQVWGRGAAFEIVFCEHYSLKMVSEGSLVAGTQSFYIGGEHPVVIKASGNAGTSSRVLDYLVILKTGEPTAENAIDATKANNGVRYNLAGQLVGESLKGIVIENGKKYIKK